MPWDTMALIYTSGTTGPSKGVLCSYLHYYTVGVLAVGFIEPHERCLISMPLFHLGATGGVYGALVRQAGIGVIEGFSTDRSGTSLRSMNCAPMRLAQRHRLPEKRPAAANGPRQSLRRFGCPVDEQIRELARRHGLIFHRLRQSERRFRW